MIDDDPRWWLHMPRCAKCGKSHVLTDCSKRLPWELDEAPIQTAMAA